MKMESSQYIEKVKGCFLGKAVGGTLGGPYEGQPGPLNLSYYDPVPQTMLANDDLDLQVVWLEQLLSNGLPVNCRQLAQGWLENIELFPDEYGIARRNLERGLYPPLSGHFDNPFTAGMGAAIRTELWACLAPANPELAVRLTLQDAVVDHSGEGVYAAMFLAALESVAFVNQNRQDIVAKALDFIPAECRVAQAISDTVRWCQEHADWLAVRELILENHGSQNFTDVAQNLAIIVLGLLKSNEFGESLCIAVNCGCDTDCTGATLGALLGILNPNGIDQKWLKPIGLDVVLSPGMVGMHPVADLDKMCKQITDLMPAVVAGYGVEPAVAVEMPEAGGEMLAFAECTDPRDAVVSLKPLFVQMRYPKDLVFYPDKPETVLITVKNPYPTTISGSLTLKVPFGWKISSNEADFSLGKGETKVIEIRITAPVETALRCYKNDLGIQIQAQGMQWTVTAGLPQSTPWKTQLVKAAVESPDEVDATAPGEIIECVGGKLTVGPELTLAQVRMKLPYKDTYTIVVQGNQPCSVFVDGEKLYDYAGDFFVPAMHRNRTAVPKKLTRGWHALQILTPEGEKGEFFVSIGNGDTWKLQQAIEWKLP